MIYAVLFVFAVIFGGWFALGLIALAIWNLAKWRYTR